MSVSLNMKTVANIIFVLFFTSKSQKQPLGILRNKILLKNGLLSICELIPGIFESRLVYRVDAEDRPTMPTLLLLLAFFFLLLSVCDANVWGPLGALRRRLFGWRTRERQWSDVGDVGRSEDRRSEDGRWLREELEAENEILRDQVRQLKRLAVSQKEYNLGLRKDKEALRRLLETSLRDSEARLTEEFMAEKAELLRVLQNKHEEERAKWKVELQIAKSELAAKSRSLNDALDSVAKMKLTLAEAASARERREKKDEEREKIPIAAPPSSQTSKRDREKREAKIQSEDSSNLDSVSRREREEVSSSSSSKRKKLREPQR